MKIGEVFKQLDSFVSTVPTLVGNEAVNFFKDNFTKQGFQGQSFSPWPARKKETKKSLGKPILIQSGDLERSIQVKNKDANSVVVGTAGQIPYAQIHNEGGIIHQAARSETFVRNRYKKGINTGKFKKGVKAGKGLTFKERDIVIPKRQYMGDSPILRERINKTLLDEFKKSITGT